MSIHSFKVLMFAGLSFVLGRAHAVPLRIAAAADLRFALVEVIKSYEQKNPQEKIETIFGASGKLATQIVNGAPFDLFLSADTEQPEMIKKSLKVKGDVFPYAHGHLALWVRKESKFELQADLKNLTDQKINKIAIANPQHAPYGKAAEAALKKANVYGGLTKKLVLGENISQAAQFVESGAADIGLIAMSLAQSPALKEEGRFMEVDASLYAPLLQSGLVLDGTQKVTAEKFRQFFLSAESFEILKKFGLSPIVATKL